MTWANVDALLDRWREQGWEPEMSGQSVEDDAVTVTFRRRPVSERTDPRGRVRTVGGNHAS